MRVRSPFQDLPRPIQTPGAPTTRAEFEALVMKRAELQDQYQSAKALRSSIIEQHAATGDPARKAELAGRERALEGRMIRLESEIFSASDAIASAMANGVANEARPGVVAGQPPRGGIGFGPGARNFRAFDWAVLVLLGIVVMRWVVAWGKRGRPAGILPDQSARFEEMQRSIDAIAVEVERISENQRYVTKVLKESLQPMVGAGDAQPIGTARKAAEPVRRPGEAL
jgi:hypothetical protein